MKKILLALALVAGTVAANAQSAAVPQQAAPQDKNAPKFQFTGGETHDFGTVAENGDISYDFEFKNTGKTPLIITAADASCGCTAPAFSKDPVLPGKKGKITVVYHTKGRPGPFAKTVFITSNAQSPAGKTRYELFIKGTVTPATAAPVTAPQG